MVFVPLENFSLNWRRCRRKAANVDLCAAPTVTRDIRYSGHLRRTMTLRHMPSVWQWSCHLSVLTIKVCRGWDSNIKLQFCGVNALTDCATCAARLCLCQTCPLPLPATSPIRPCFTGALATLRDLLKWKESTSSSCILNSPKTPTRNFSSWCNHSL